MKLTIRLNHKVKKGLAGVFLLICGGTYSQEFKLDLNTCYTLAEKTSPLKKQEAYLGTINQLTGQIQLSRNLPDLVVKGSASYQSDVFGLPFTLPGSEVPAIPKDQYQVTLNINQILYGGGQVTASRRLEQSRISVQRSQMEVALFQIRLEINELYFGILQLRAQQETLSAVRQELSNQQERARAAVNHGILLPGSLKSLQKEILILDQQMQESSIREQNLFDLLAQRTGKQYDRLTTLEWPTPTEGDRTRPERQVFAAQLQQLEQQKDVVHAGSLPKLVGFGTAGYGQPNPFNFFETEWNTFYIVGARLEWQPWDWNSNRKQQQIIDMNQQIVKSEQSEFDERLYRQELSLQAEIDQLESMLVTDRQLLKLQEDIQSEATARFEQGVISASDYLTEMNNLTQAKLRLKGDEIRLLKARIDRQTLLGNAESQ